jgi:hypothetical protein
MNYSQDEDIIPILICNISYSSETYLWFSPRFFLLPIPMTGI